MKKYDNDLYREIKSERDQNLLQRDLDEIVKWSEENKIPLNIKKCGKMTFSSKRKTKSMATEYSIKGENLHSFEKFIDLGVVFPVGICN